MDSTQPSRARPARVRSRAAVLAVAMLASPALVPGPRLGAGDVPQFVRTGDGELTLRLDDPARWTAEPSWLGNPGRDVEARRGEAGVVLIVREPGRGMKWRCSLGEPVDVTAYRYVDLRYRARGAGREADYLLAVLGGPPGGPETYRTPVPALEIRPDGYWRRASGPLGDASGGWILRGLALQAQAAGRTAELEVSEIRLLRDAPLVAAAEMLPHERLDSAAGFPEGWCALDLAPLANRDSASIREPLGLRDGIPPGRISACGIPFQVLVGPRDCMATPLEDRDAALTIPLSGRASAVALLIAARLEGDEEPAIGSGPLREIRDVDRALFRLRYEDGSPDEMLPLSLPAREFALVGGLQVAVLFADPGRGLAAAEVLDRSAQLEVHVLAATAAVSPDAGLEPLRPRATRPESIVRRDPRRMASQAALDGGRAVLRGGALEAVVDLADMSLGQLSSGWVARDLAAAGGSRFLRLEVSGAPAGSPTAWKLIEASVTAPGRVSFRSAVDLGPEVPTPPAARGASRRVEVRGRLGTEDDELWIELEIESLGGAVELELVAPDLRGIVVGGPDTDRLFYPKRGAVLTSAPGAWSRPGTGLFPVQFLDVSSASGGGVYVRTEDREGLDRLYEASKGPAGASLSVRWPLRLEPGRPVRLPRVVVGVHGRDGHAAFEAYRRWLSEWHRPRLPLKPWFREVFNFRQRFFWFWDPLYDRESGRFRVEEAIEEARAELGGLEYLHLMDWGSLPSVGRVYARPGDHVPWEAWKGGPDSLARAIDACASEGVPVGMYVEGYLLEERGKLGSGPGRSWQILGPAGERRYWPGATEMFICPRVEAWRKVQVETYRRLAGMFPVRGFYIDQFGFADWGKTCWAEDHGHEVPARPLRGEIVATRAVSEALAARDPGIAIYTEETPSDLANGFQDGSFTYAMNEAQRTVTDVPLNIARFAFPSFKTFEILVCDQPTGSWATGVLWTFFNGEGLWLEGPAREWFAPRTRDAIRKAHAILRAHRDAFTTATPEPLVPTLVEGIHANRFPGPSEDVVTFWSALPVTYRGPAIALPADLAGRPVRDLWNDRPASVGPGRDGEVEVSLEIGPRGVGCISVAR